MKPNLIISFLALILCCLVNISVTHAQDITTIYPDKNDQYDVLYNQSYAISLTQFDAYSDSEKHYPKQNQLSSIKDIPFKRIEKIHVDTFFRYRSDNLWGRYVIQNKSDQDGEWAFRVSNNIQAEIYIADKEEIELAAYFSDEEYSSDNELTASGLTARLFIPSNSSKTIYVKFNPEQVRGPKIQLISSKQYEAFKTRELVTLSAYCIALTMLLIINLSQFSILNKKVRFYYTFQNMTYLFVPFVVHDFGVRYLWNNALPLDEHMVIVATLIPSVAIFLFMRALFDIRVTLPGWDKFICTLIGIYSTTILVSFINPLWPDPIYTFLWLFAPVVCLITGVIFWRKGDGSALYYLLGWLLLVAGCSFVLISEILGGDKGGNVEIIEFFVVIESLFMFLAQMKKMSLIKQAHDQQKDELISIYQQRNNEIQNLLEAESERTAALEKYKEKVEHIASISHDLFQPLQSLKFTVQAQAISKSENPYTASMEKALNHIEGLIHEVLVDSESEYMTAESRFDLINIFKDTTALHAHEAELKHIELRYFKSSIKLTGSKVILHRVVSNLTSNAISHNTSATVLLGVRKRNQSIDIQVIDNGKGIEPEKIQSLLKPFSQEKNQTNHYGLGLHIVKMLCDEAGYDFNVSSEKGKGSCFSVSIPLENQ